MKLAMFKAKQTLAERKFVRKRLAANSWGLGTTAAELGISPTTMLSTIKRLDLTAEYKRCNPGVGRRK